MESFIIIVITGLAILTTTTILTIIMITMIAISITISIIGNNSNITRTKYNKIYKCNQTQCILTLTKRSNIRNRNTSLIILNRNNNSRLKNNKLLTSLFAIVWTGEALKRISSISEGNPIMDWHRG